MLNLSKHLSFVYCNVQSIVNKLDTLYTELTDFDILAFSDAWLHLTIQTTDLIIPDFKPPQRKDKEADRLVALGYMLKTHCSTNEDVT